MIILLMGSALISFSVNQIAIRIFQKRYEEKGLSVYFFQFIFCIFAAMTCFLAAKNLDTAQNPTILFGCLFGLSYFLTVLMLSACFAKGEMVISSVIINMSFIVPIFYSIVFLHEKVTVTQVIGTLLICFAIYTSSRSDAKEQSGVKSKSVYLLALGSFLFNGCCAIIQKYYKLAYEIDEDMLFLTASFLTAAMLYGLLFVFKRRNVPGISFASTEKTDDYDEYQLYIKNIGIYFLAILAGLSTFAGNALMMYLNPRIPASILLPIVNGGMCLLLTVCSVVFFGEKMTKSKYLLLIFGIFAIIVINL